ncbi:MAG: hypothetical protein HY843_02985 [Bdellovibrio sp.]|nr:hypothetical protein [Bdellovibrio sp.]
MPENKFNLKTSRSRRKSERAFVLNRIKGVFLRCSQLTRPEIRVTNISETGLGLDSSLLTQLVTTLRTVNGQLLIGKTVFPVTLKLVRVSNGIAGFEFVEPREMIQNAIRVYFEAEIIGANLKQTSDANVGEETEEHKIYKFDDNQANYLEIEVKKQKIIRFNIGFFGNNAEWSPEGGLYLIQHSKIQPIGAFLRKQLIQFVISADTLKPDLQKQMEKILLGVRN